MSRPNTRETQHSIGSTHQQRYSGTLHRSQTPMSAVTGLSNNNSKVRHQHHQRPQSRSRRTIIEDAHRAMDATHAANLQAKLPTVHVLTAIATAAGAVMPRANDACQSLFPIKVDYRMTVESLREQVFTLYAAHCSDGGIDFLPPSYSPHDYEIRHCSSDCLVDRVSPALQPAELGGDLLRVQISHLAAPIHLAMVIGEDWNERSRLEQREHQEREALINHRLATMESAHYFASVSLARAKHRRAFVDQQMRMVREMEEAMFSAMCSQHRAAVMTAQVRREFAETESNWQSAIVERNKMAAELEKQKRISFQASAAASGVRKAAVDAIMLEPSRAEDLAA